VLAFFFFATTVVRYEMSTTRSIVRSMVRTMERAESSDGSTYIIIETPNGRRPMAKWGGDNDLVGREEKRHMGEEGRKQMARLLCM
jgi:hypothetical protein